MSGQSPPSSPGAGRRRSSLTEMFISRPSPSTHASSGSPPHTNLSTPMGNTQSNRRGMSITTLGLSGNSPNQSSPLTSFAKQRRASVASSSVSGSPEFRNGFEDSAMIEEEEDQNGVPANTPATPSFARRLSFGAQALRDVKSTGGASGGRRPSLYATLQEQPENEPSRNDVSPITSRATTRGGSRGEGFNWAEALRDRTRRQPSVSAGAKPYQHRPRAASITALEPPKEMPQPQSPPVAAKLSKPDPLGERMLRGDFMMD